MTNKDTKKLIKDIQTRMKKMERRRKEDDRALVQAIERVIELSDDDDLRVPVLKRFVEKHKTKD